MNILELIKSQLGSQTVEEMSNSVGAPKENTSNALMSVVPLIMGAMARNTKSEEGANSLAGALDRDHDGGVLGKLGSLISNPEEGQGNGILGHLFGAKRPAVEQTVSQKSGLDIGQTSKLLMMVAPVVMGFIGKKKREDNLDAGGVAGMIQAQSEQDEKDESGSGIGGMITGLLDRDGDGDVMDDVAGMIGGLFK